MANRYWVGGSGTWDSSSTAHWSATSGGAAGASAPISSDDVFFDASSGGTYTVTCNGGTCNAITVNSGTVTFNVASSGQLYFNAYGNINISAATVFTTTSANSFGVIGHVSGNATLSATFNSSTTNTQKVYFSAYITSTTAYTWCTASTQTFHSVEIITSAVGTFTCAGSTITIDNQNRATSGVSDIFSIQTSDMSVAATTIRMGSVTANGGNTVAQFLIQCQNRATEPTLTGLNVTYIRAYNSTSWSTKWYNTSGDGFPFRFGALTFLSNQTNNHQITGVYGTSGIFSATNIYLTLNPQASNATTFTGAFTLAGSTLSYNTAGGQPTSITFTSTTTLSVSNTLASTLDLSNIAGNITFTGAVSITGGTVNYAQVSFYNSGTVNFSSTLTCTGTVSTNYPVLISTSGASITVAGNTSLTNTQVSAPSSGNWSQTGASTFTITSNPTSSIISSFTTVFSFIMGTGATSITSTNFQTYSDFTSSGLVTVTGAATSTGINFTNQNGGCSFVAATLATWTDVNISTNNFIVTGVGGFTLAGATKNSGISGNYINVTGPINLTVSDSNRSITLRGANGSGFALQSGGLITISGVSTVLGAIFTAQSGNVSFTAATLATWTDVAVSVNGSFTVTGVGGYTLAGTTKNSSVNITGAWAVTGPTTLNAAANLNIIVDSVTAGGGAFAVNSTAGTTGIFTINANNVGTSQFSSTFAVTNMGFNANCNNLTFSSSITLTNPNRINVYGNATTISSNLSISSTNLIDGIDGFYGNPFIFSGSTLTTSSTSAAWTFTNARIYFQFSNAGTIANPVTLADNGGLYWSASNLTLTSALTSSGASKWNILLLKTYGATLTLNGAVTLVNCQLAATNIVVLGGATKNFAYSLSTPICNNTTVNTTEYYGSSKAQNYPEICVDSFTLTNTGGTFSIAGGGSAIYRTLVRPYRAYTADATTSSCTLTLPALTPTLTDVDFWRATVAGAVTKPLTGTRLGNVGTITNITTATPKSVYWVGGAGAWSDARWATATGGAGSVLNYPLPQDNVYFDANSGTGAATYPASVRVKGFIVDAVPAGTRSVYCNSTNATTSPSYLWVSGDVNGPAATPTGTFILGNDSSFTYNSFTSGLQLQTIVIADSSASDTHTINPVNINFMSFGNMQFATLGTTTISSSITAPLYSINDYCTDAYTINITAAQIGSSSYDYVNSNYSFFSLGTTASGGTGTISYGACSIYTGNFYVSSLTSNTAYTVNIGQILYAYGATQVGNINFVGSPSASSTVWYMYVDTSVSCLSLNIKDYGSSGTSALSINGSAIPISMYAFTVTYNGSATGMLLYGTNQTFTKLGGGSVSVTGVNISNTSASPANTWYTTGTVTSSTGWNSGAGPNSKGGFLLFQ